MRIPTGAPTGGWLRIQQTFPYFKRYKFKKPPFGTIVVIGFLGVTGTAITCMFVLPKIYSDYFRKSQTEKRSYMHIDRESVAQGLRPWSDPFDRDRLDTPANRNKPGTQYKKQ